MDILNENIQNYNDKIDLIITSSLLKNSNDILYNPKNKNTLLIDYYYLEYSSINIDSDINKNKILSVITKNLKLNNDFTIVILTDSNENSNKYLGFLKNILNKDNYSEHNINSISFTYSFIDEKNKKIEIKNLSDIPIIEEDNLFIKAKVKYKDDIIYSCLKILIINNLYENVCPLFCLNHKDYEFDFFKNSINKLLSEEKKFQNALNNLPLLNKDFLEEINSFKKEANDYYSKFINTIEKMYYKFNNTKLLTKNDFNIFIRDVNNIMDKINKENFQFKQNSLYKQYIKIYNNVTDISLSDKNHENLKSLFINFNNLNEEIANLLENNPYNKEIANLKNSIKMLQNQLKEDKSKNLNNPKDIMMNNSSINNFSTISNNNTISSSNFLNYQNNSKSKPFMQVVQLNKDSSLKRYHNRNIFLDNKTSNSNTITYEDYRNNELELKYLRRKVNQLNETISNLIYENENLAKSNERMKLNINKLNRIIAKIHKNNNENDDETVYNDIIVKNSSIKSFKPKYYFNQRNNHSGQKKNDKSKDTSFYNTINNDSINGYSYKKKKINMKLNLKNTNNNSNNNTLNDYEHYAILKKIHDEKKDRSIRINDIYYMESSKNINYIEGNNGRSISKNNRMGKTTNHNSNSKIHNKTALKGNKSSVPKIRIFKKNYHK